MKDNQKMNHNWMAAVFAVGLLANFVPAASAEETAAAENTQMDMASSGETSERVEKRRERFEQWLEKHPKAKERLDKNGNGAIDPAEFKEGRQQLRKRRMMREQGRFQGDKDNNPPGPRGGEGTNWENRPGPQGGPGNGPDRAYRNRGGSHAAYRR